MNERASLCIETLMGMGLKNEMLKVIMLNPRLIKNRYGGFKSSPLLAILRLLVPPFDGGTPLPAHPSMAKAKTLIIKIVRIYTI
jgi:hypothetical protein